MIALALGMLPAGVRAEEEQDDPLLPADMLFEGGIFLGAFVPSKAHEIYDPTLRHQQLAIPAFDVGARAGFFPSRYAGVELEGAFVPAQTKAGDSVALIALRAEVVGQYPLRVTPFVLVGGGALIGRSTALGNDLDPELHFGLGAKAGLLPWLLLRLDLRQIITGAADNPGEDSTTSHFEILLGASFLLGREAPVDQDPDKDGILLAQDKCPTVRGVPPDGCEPKDSDKDGVIDDLDRCPNEAGSDPDGCSPKDSDADGFIDRADACPTEKGIEPDGCPDPDPDGDGVPANRDRCPEQKGIEPDGCPDPDPDKDGVLGAADLCPNEAGVPTDGCPDRDLDGLSDLVDKCPEQPETKNGYQDSDGCPDDLPKEVKKFTGAIRGINFKSGSAEITPASFSTLTAAGKVLLAYPELRLEIQGHTDNVGSPEINLKLSTDRAEAVRTYLVAQGVVGDRLVAQGYGMEVPVADNKTAAGKAKNRRIEFRLIQ